MGEIGPAGHRQSGGGWARVKPLVIQRAAWRSRPGTTDAAAAEPQKSRMPYANRPGQRYGADKGLPTGPVTLAPSLSRSPTGLDGDGSAFVVRSLEQKPRPGVLAACSARPVDAAGIVGLGGQELQLSASPGVIGVQGHAGHVAAFPVRVPLRR